MTHYTTIKTEMKTMGNKQPTIAAVPEVKAPRVDLTEIEMESMGVETAGRALRAMSDLTRRRTRDDSDTLDNTRRDDLAALFELIGDALVDRELAIREQISLALRRQGGR